MDTNQERWLYSTRLSKKMFVKPLFLLALFVAFGAMSSRLFSFDYHSAVGIGLVLIGVAQFASAVLRYFLSQFTVTTRRIVVRHGVLSRQSYEMLLSKVESIAVARSFSDRFIWGAGTLVITGTGGTREAFPNLGSAKRFEWHLNNALHQH